MQSITENKCYEQPRTPACVAQWGHLIVLSKFVVLTQNVIFVS